MDSTHCNFIICRDNGTFKKQLNIKHTPVKTYIKYFGASPNVYFSFESPTQICLLNIVIQALINKNAKQKLKNKENKLKNNNNTENKLDNKYDNNNPKNKLDNKHDNITTSSTESCENTTTTTTTTTKLPKLFWKLSGIIFMGSTAAFLGYKWFNKTKRFESLT